MRIKITKIEECNNFDECYQADCLDCPGIPPVGYGKTKEEAVAALFYQFIFDTSSNWFNCIKLNEPIVINDKIWENPCKINK